MVYRGGPSKGCDTCRARKVKCTEEKPHCLRCQQGGFICLGYHRRSRAALKKENYQLHIICATDPRPIASSTDTSPSSVQPTFFREWSWDQRSTSFFLDQFVVAPSHGQNVGWFEFLPELLYLAEPCSALENAFRGVSYLSFANRHNYDKLKFKALRLYGEALNATNKELESPTMATRDTTFAAILLLCLFGHINGDLRMQISIHALGMYHLLALRSMAGVNSDHDTSLVRHFFALMHLENNEKYLSPPSSSNDGHAAEVPQPESLDLFARLGMLWPVSAALLNMIQSQTTREVSQADTGAILQLLGTAKELEQQVQQAAQGLDPIWYYSTVTDHNAFEKSKWNTPSRKVLVYHDSWVMSMWHGYRVTRISLNIGMIDCCDWLVDTGLLDSLDLFDQDLKELRRESLDIIDAMNEDICSSIPWTLGHFDSGDRNSTTSLPKASQASLSIVGLKTVVNRRFTRQHHSTQAADALWEIAYRFGIKGAL